MRKLRVEELNRLSVEEFQAAPKYPISVVLDNVRSMHNVGSVFRTCDAFRVEKLYLCGITPRPPHREIHKTAIGAQDSVDWQYKENCLDLILQLKGEGYTLIAIEQAEGSNVLASYGVNPSDRYAIILGHEIQGVQQAVINHCDATLEIPQYGTKHSLNISVVAGIVLHHFIPAFSLNSPA